MAYELVNYDQESIKNSLYNELRSFTEWAGIPAESDSADTIVKLIIYMMTYNSSLEVSFLNAEFLDSVPSLSNSYNVLYSFANFIGMPVQNLTSASGTVSISSTATAAKQIVIPFGTKLSDESGQIIFSTTQTTFIPAGATYAVNYDSGVAMLGSGVTRTQSLSNLPITPGTLVVNYRMGTTDYVAIDNGIGGITGTSIVSGTINYTTGAISITFSGVGPAVAPTLSYEYQVGIPVVQGIFKTQIYTANGSDYQKMYIIDNVEEYNTTVTINDEIYTRVDDFLFSTNVDKHYIIRKTRDGVYVQLSNGVNGFKPASGSKIIIQYLTSSGNAGNVFTPSVITKVIDKIYDIDNAQVTGIVSNNSAPLIGGYDGDDLNKIKQNIKLFFSSINLSTRESYQDYLRQSPLVLDSRVVAGWENFPSDTTKWTTIYMYILPAQYPTVKTLSLAEKTQLFNYVKEKDVFFTYLSFEDLDYIGIVVDFEVRLSSNLLSQSAINQVRNSIYNGVDGIVDDYFNFEKIVDEAGTAFRNIYGSEMIASASAVSNVKAVDLYLYTAEKTLYQHDHSAGASQGWTGYNVKFDNMNSDRTYLYIGNTKLGIFEVTTPGVLWTLNPEATAPGSLISSATLSFASNIVLDITLTDDFGEDYDDQFIYIRSEPENQYDIITENPNILFELYSANVTII